MHKIPTPDYKPCDTCRATVLSTPTDRDMWVGRRMYPAGTVTVVDILDHAAREATTPNELISKHIPEQNELRGEVSSNPTQRAIHELAEKEWRNEQLYITCTCGVQSGPWYVEDYAMDWLEVHAARSLATPSEPLGVTKEKK